MTTFRDFITDMCIELLKREDERQDDQVLTRDELIDIIVDQYIGEER